MAKPPTFPFLFDEEKSISVSNLKKWKFLEMNNGKKGTLIWSINKINTDKMSIKTFISEFDSHIELEYKCNGINYNYKIPLITLPSNLSAGNIWYFLCPFTNKRCRKVHLIDGLFMHRSALPSGVYSKQIQTKKWRQMEKTYGCYFDNDKHFEEIYSKHFKKYYNGKPTKRYLKLLQKINEADSFSVDEIERLYIL